MSECIPVYLFRGGHFSPGGNTVVSVIRRDVVDAVYNEGGLSKAFGGYCLFRNDDTGAHFLGVWGARNASRFRNALRRGGVSLEIVRGPPPARLIMSSTTGFRPAKPHR